MRAPSCFGQGQGAGISHIEKAFGRWDALAPERTCHTEEMVLLEGFAEAPGWVKAIGLLERGDGHTPVDLGHIAWGCGIVKVAMLARAEHDVGSILLCRADSRSRQSVAPGKGDAALGDALEIRFVPEHRRLAVTGAQGVDDAVEEVLLQPPVFAAVGKGNA